MSETLAYDIIARDLGASRTFENVGDACADAGKQSRVFQVEQKALSKQISDTEAHLKGLIRQIDGTENKELFKSIRKDQSLLTFLKRAEKQLKDAGDEGGKKFLSGFGDALSGLPSTLKGSAIVGAVAIAPFLAAPIAAAVGGAVLGGVGVGGIIGGVVAAAQDERVKNAGTALGENFLGGVKDAGRIFINPVLDQMSTLQRTEDVFLADLAAGFAKLAPVIKPVVDGLEGLAENLNLDQAFGDALPAVRAIGHELPQIGDAIGDALHSIGEGSDGATEGLLTVLHATEDLIRFTGEFIRVGSNVYDWFVRTGNAATGFGLKVTDAFGWLSYIPGVGQAFDLYRDHIQGLHDETQSLIDGLDDAKKSGDDWRGNLADQARSTKEAADEVKQYTDALEKLFGIQLGVDEAQLHYQQAIDETLKTLKEGKRTLNINTEDGRDNTQAILDQIKAIEDLRRANINNGQAVEDANAIANGQIAALETTLIRLGFNKQAIHDLIDAYIELKRKAYVETHVDDKSVQIAYGHVKAVEAEMARLNGNVSTVYVRTVFGEYRAGERNPSGRATGGGVEAGPMYWVGENGPELVSFSRSGRVYPAGQSRAMAAAGGAPGGAAQRIELVVTVRPAPGASRQLMDNVVEGLQYDVETVGGGSVVTLLERPK